MPTKSVGVFLIALVLAGCADEKPDQQLVQNEASAEQRDQTSRVDAQRQRTLGQGESNRIYNEGGLR